MMLTERSFSQYPDDAYKLRKVSELGIDRDQIHDREFTWVELEGERIYLYPVYDTEQDAWIACAYPEEEMKAPRVVTTLLLWLIFGVLLSGLTYSRCCCSATGERQPGSASCPTTVGCTAWAGSGG